MGISMNRTFIGHMRHGWLLFNGAKVKDSLTVRQEGNR